MYRLAIAIAVAASIIQTASASSYGDAAANLQSTYGAGSGYTVDSAPSGYESTVILEGPGSSVGMPGADSVDSVVQTSPGRTQIQMGSGMGGNGPYDANSDNTTIVIDEE